MQLAGCVGGGDELWGLGGARFAVVGIGPQDAAEDDGKDAESEHELSQNRHFWRRASAAVVRPARSAASRKTAMAASIFMPAIMWYDVARSFVLLTIMHVVEEAGEEQQGGGDADPFGPGGAAAAEELIDGRGAGRRVDGRDDEADVEQAADEDDRAQDVQDARDEHAASTCR